MGLFTKTCPSCGLKAYHFCRSDKKVDKDLANNKQVITTEKFYNCDECGYNRSTTSTSTISIHPAWMRLLSPPKK